MKADKETELRLERLIADFAVQIGQQEQYRFESTCGQHIDQSNSPIERLMAAALFFTLQSHDWYGGGPVENMFAGQLADHQDFRNFTPSCMGIYVVSQCKVGKYTADFMVCVADWRGGYVWGAIECDGHDYHDLTKEQARHDRARDGAFQDAGIFILRYTGSEIWKSPLKCAVDAIRLLERRAEADTALRWKAKF